ncbi:unnamed protein product [Ostreobium quekettii]|uniref:Tyrosine-protein kinase ephrin type A/B receptor-like domain-containing protein n=1 Tax=Ostreobium quekettii TaxID=121088 RepID=A0A8S1JAX2_9CHLO|nr:unnamed protein product [Ostreobium quekettii]|eukprot:evm.model.scf_940.4 EVM.evm.TU.scf_940.4   scf_940:28829-50416(+)
MTTRGAAIVPGGRNFGAVFLLIVLLAQEDAGFGVKCMVGAVPTNSTAPYALQGRISSIQPSCVHPWEETYINVTVEGMHGGRANMSCYFLSSTAFTKVGSNKGDQAMSKFLADGGLQKLQQASNTKGALQHGNGTNLETWSCRVPSIATDVDVIPVLVANWAEPVEGGWENVTISGTTVSQRIYRSGVQKIWPSLLPVRNGMAVSLEGEGLEPPIQCICSGGMKRSSAVVATPHNVSFARCTLLDPLCSELNITWHEGSCASTFPVGFYERPNVSNIYPATIPRWGFCKLTLELSNVDPAMLRNLMSSPSMSAPLLRLRGHGHVAKGIELVGSFNITNGTKVEFNISTVHQPLMQGLHHVEFALNGMDFINTSKVINASGPYVVLPKTREGLEEGGSLNVTVELSGANSLMPVTAKLKLMAVGSASSLAELVNMSSTSVSWARGEAGLKVVRIDAFPETASRWAQGTVAFELQIDSVSHADRPSALSDRTTSIFLLQKGELPVFKVIGKMVLYPDSSAYHHPQHALVALTSGSSAFNSTLRYIIKQSRPDKGHAPVCSTAVGVVKETTGLIKWRPAQKNLSLPIHLHWGNMTYSTELHVSIVLEPVEVASVLHEEVVVLHAFGVQNDSCPPGFKTSSPKPRNVIDTGGRLVHELSLRGHSGKSRKHTDKELNPSFTPDQHSYVALVPFGLMGARLVIHSRVEGSAIAISGSDCLVDRDLKWSDCGSGCEPASEMREAVAHVSLPKDNQKDCHLVVHARKLETATNTTSGLGGSLRGLLSTPQRNPSFDEYHVSFLQLGNPSQAELHSVVLRNETHMLEMCGPWAGSAADIKERQWLEDVQQEGSHVLIPGYPTQKCTVHSKIILDTPPAGDPLWIIPRLKHPEVLETTVEVYGVIVQGPGKLQGSALNATEIPTANRSSAPTIVGTRMMGLPSFRANFSLGFDILVTAADRVTSNRYQFVLGNDNRTRGEAGHGQREKNDSVLSRDWELKGWPKSPAQNAQCHACEKGHYSSGVNVRTCSKCAPGHFADTYGSCKCTPCPAGTFTYNWASENCRSCILGTYTSETASQYCKVCEEGWMTDGDMRDNCTVKLLPTDLSREYAIIVSLGVILNGSSLDEIQTLKTGLISGVNASGVAVLELSIRADMAGVFNISMGDVFVTHITDMPDVGHRRLLLNVSSTVKVDDSRCVSGTKEECEAAFNLAEHKADDKLIEVQNNPDAYLQRTIQATNSQRQVSLEKSDVKRNWPSNRRKNFWIRYGLIAFPIMAVGLLVVSAVWWWRRLTKKERLRFMDAMPLPRSLHWDVLRVPSGSTLGDEDPDDVDSDGAVVRFPGSRHRIPVSDSGSASA